jgi:L-glutamine-phosphate cytidylyltransferase
VDALILAAGRGSRLGTLTDDRPKALINLDGVTPLKFQIDILLQRGIGRFIVVTGYRGGMVARASAAAIRGRAELVTVWNPFWSVTNVIGSVWQAREQLRGDFVYLHADTVFAPGILDDALSAPAPVVLPVDFRECEPEQMKAEVADRLVLHLSKELPAERTAGEFIGIGVFRETALSSIQAGVETVLRRGELGAYFEAAINEAIADGCQVMAIPTDGRPWTEIDFAEDAAAARAFLPRLMGSSDA